MPVLQASAECNPATDPCAPKKVLDAWQKSLAFGFNLTSGNSDTSLLTAMGKATKETSADSWDLGLAYSNGKDDNKVVADDSDLGTTTRNDVRSNASYKYLLSERTFTGVDANFLYDEVAKVDYRVNFGPTLGYYLIKNADYSFFVDAGPGYLFEKVDGVDNNYFAPKVGEGFTWVISCTSKLYETVNVLFDTEDSSNYIVNAEAGIESALSSTMSLLIGARQTFDNQPAAGLEKGDLAVISAIKVNL